jgi:serine/threonine-protein kinase
LPDPSFAAYVRLLDYVGHAAEVLVALTALLVVWRQRNLSLRALRGIELGLFGLACALLALWQFRWFQSGHLRSFAGADRGRDAVLLASGGLTSPWLMLIMVYGTSIPNTGRRCAAVVTCMAVVPILLTLVVAYQDPLLRPALLVDFLPGNLLVWLLVAGAIAVYGSHRVSTLRREVFAARELGQYRLKRCLGAGGMGEVYLAEHRLLRRPCAVKLIRPERAGDASSLQRFEREVQTMATLKHWNTVEIYDYGRADDGTFYYVMEYLPGWNLDDLVERHGVLPAGRVVHVVRQLCAALREAHAVGLVHRDIKPGNIILCERGGVCDVVKLLDFGLVKTVAPRGGSSALTLEGIIVGTPDYMSPEQAQGKLQLDGRSDIYSLGAVMYYLLTGRAVFDHENVMRVIAAHITDPVLPPSVLQAEVPADLESVVLHCLQKDAGQRFASAEALAEAVNRCACAAHWSPEQAAAWWNEHPVPDAADPKESARSGATIPT